MIYPDNIEDIVAEWLEQTPPSSANPRVKMALGHFISQLDEESHNQILPGWTKRRESRGTKRKAADTPTASDEHKAEDLDDGLAKIQEEALAYLNKRQRARARRKRKIKPTVEPAVVRGAIKALREGHVWNCENNIEDLWAGDNPILISDDFKRSSPMRRLGMLHADAISSVHSNECKRRITALLIHDGHKQAASIVEDSNELPAAELAQLIGLPAVSAKNAISTARGWLRFIGAWGLGGLVLPGPGHREVFERDLSNAQLKDLWDYCQMRMPNITTKVGSMHETVRRHLTKAIQIYGGDSTALQSGQSRLAEAYQKDWGAENSRSLQQPTDNSMVLNHPSSSCRGSNGLVALAEIADMRLQNETSGQLGDIFETYNDETVNMQARTAPSFGTAPAATVTHQALGPGTAENLQPAWWQGADSCPVSGSLCQDIPLDSAPSLPLDQLAQAQLAPSDGTMDYWDGWRQPLFDEFVHDIGE